MKNKNVAWFVAFLAIFAFLIFSVSARAALPFTVKPGHPRIYLDSTRVSEIRAAALVTILLNGATVLPKCSTDNYKISGAVRKNSSNGSRLGGAVVQLNGPNCGQLTTTTTRNDHAFTGLKNGSYTLSPSKIGCTFTPASRSVSINSNNVSGWSKTGFARSGASCN